MQFNTSRAFWSWQIYRNYTHPWDDQTRILCEAGHSICTFYISHMDLHMHICSPLSDFCPEQKLIPSGSNFLLFYETEKTFDNSRFIILMSKIHDSCWHPLTQSSQCLHQIKIASLHQFLLQRCYSKSCKKIWLKTLRRCGFNSLANILAEWQWTLKSQAWTNRNKSQGLKAPHVLFPSCLGTFSLSPCHFLPAEIACLLISTCLAHFLPQVFVWTYRCGINISIRD